jgi:two-component system sensor histidine kinase RpfC
LIENVLDISKIEAGKIEIMMAPFDLHELIQKIIRMQQPTATSKSLTLYSNIDPAIHFNVIGDEQHLRQVLINLIGNAIKFTQSGHVYLTLNLSHMDGPVQRVRFEIHDSGIGIPESALATIFEDFKRVHHASGTFSGTGLGTTISKELVELMEGEIGVSSELGVGSTFWFELPLKIQTNHPVSLGQQRILLLSTDGDYRLIAEMTQTWNITTTFVSSVEALLNELYKAKTHASPYSTVLLDYRLLTEPALLELTELIHTDKRISDTALLLTHCADVLPPNLHQYFSSVLETTPNKTQLFNSLHAANASHLEHDNVVSLADFYSAKNTAKPLKILIAEDNKVNQQVLNGLLTRAGYNTIVTETGEETIEILTSQGQEIDLMILDMNLSDYSGVEILKALNFIDVDRIPCIMLTADATPKARQQSLEAGADVFMTKPIDSRALLSEIARLSAVDNVDTPSMPTDNVSQTANSHDEADIINHKVLRDLEQLGGSSDFVETLLLNFSHDANKHLKILQSAIHDDYLAYRESLHALKGSATELGAIQLASLCQEAENLKPQDINTALMQSMFQDISVTYEKTLTEFHAAFPPKGGH